MSPIAYMVAFTQNEPVWLRAGVVAALVIAAHFGLKLDDNEQLAVHVLALLGLAAWSRLSVVPLAKLPAAAPPKS